MFKQKSIITILLSVSILCYFLIFDLQVSYAESYVNPISTFPDRGGYIGFNYDIGNNVYHLGSDFKAPVDTEVKAVLAGKVIYSLEIPGYGGKTPIVNGGVVVIEHTNDNDDKFYAVYGHVNRLVEAGATVSQGQTIGKVRTYIDAGRAWNHLHFGINTVRASYSGYTNVYPYPKSDWVEPVSYLTSHCSGSPQNPTPAPTPTTSTGSFRADYFNSDNDLSSVIWNENGLSNIDKNWGNGGPGNGVNSDYFGARFTGQINFSDGWYKFHYEVDDKIKIYIDNDCKVDQWGSHVLNEDSQPIYISGGTHTLKVEYADVGGEAKIKVNWVATIAPQTNTNTTSTTTKIQNTAMTTKYQLSVAENTMYHEYDIWFTPLNNCVYDFNVDNGGRFSEWSLYLYNEDDRNSYIDDYLVKLHPILQPGSKYYLAVYNPYYDACTYDIEFTPQVQFITKPISTLPQTSTQTVVTEAQWSDLTPTEITFNNADLGVGKTVLLESGINNSSNVETGVFNLKWYVDGEQVGYGSHEGIPANSTVINGNSQYYWTPAASGAYQIKFVIDCDDFITETNEDNNVAMASIVVPEADVSATKTSVTANSSDTVVFKIGNTEYLINGNTNTMEVAPYIKDGRTMLPVRALANAIGIPDSNITWNSYEEKVIVQKHDRKVQLTIGQNIINVNGNDIVIDVAPEITDDRTFLPLRALMDAFGISINWDDKAKSVTVNCSIADSIDSAHQF